jgi:hypothetical protein
MNIIVDGGGRVVMWSETSIPTPGAGQTRVTLTDTFRDQFIVAIATPNGGINYDAVQGITVLPFVPTVYDFSNIDNLDRVLRAIGLMCGRWNGKSVAVIKSDFLRAYQDVG